MSTFNLNSGYGRLLAHGLNNNPTGGRVFMVAKSGVANYGMLQQVFGPDGAGNVRLFNTLAAASSGITAAEGDIVYVAEGHTETFSSATAITLSVSGIRFIGLGVGSLRPTFTLDTANTATINVTAANVSFTNCLFVANFLAIASVFTLTTAKDFQLVNCEFRDTSSVLDFLFIVTTDTTSNDADGLVIDRCTVTSKTAAGVQGLVSFLGTNDRCRVSNCTYNSLSTNSAALIPIASGKILTNFQVVQNRFLIANAAGTSTGWLLTTDGSTSTGYIDGNIDNSLITTPVVVTASSGFAFGLNYHTDAADHSGYLVPAVDS